MGWPEIHELGGIYIDGENKEERIGMPGKSRAYFTKHYAHLRLPETVNADGWWNSRDEIHIRPCHLFHELPRIRVHRIQETALAFGE